MTNKNLIRKYPQFIVIYLNSLLDPRSWVEKADEMLEASKILKLQLREYWGVVLTNAKEGKYDKGGEHPYIPSPNLHGPYFILVSYALENLFKVTLPQFIVQRD